MKTKSAIQKGQAERHRSGRAGWLRAAVLGSDDAIISTASLMIGVAAASTSKAAVLVAGVAGLVAGAMSMAVGEYVSVSSQRDAEQADIGLETQELDTEPEAELQELALIYVKRGLEKDLALKVAEQLSAHDRLGAHMRDDLGIDQASLARPLQAAWIAALQFLGVGFRFRFLCHAAIVSRKLVSVNSQLENAEARIFQPRLCWIYQD
jgi:VIT1/CCC1 family predicted Fe2+/Mn2+ transporter